MNKGALLNAVVRNIMTKRAALEAKGSTKPQAKPDVKPQAKPVAKPEPKLDPALGNYYGISGRGGILDLISDKYDAYAHPYIKITGSNKDLMSYIVDTAEWEIGRIPLSNRDNPSLREYLRASIADRAGGGKLYPTFSRNRKAFLEAARRFGEYRQLQLQNLGTLKNSLLFSTWLQKNYPLVYRKLMNAPEKNRDEALYILQHQVNNRRNKGNGYV